MTREQLIPSKKGTGKGIFFNCRKKKRLFQTERTNNAEFPSNKALDQSNIRQCKKSRRRKEVCKEKFASPKGKIGKKSAIKNKQKKQSIWSLRTKTKQRT